MLNLHGARGAIAVIGCAVLLGAATRSMDPIDYYSTTGCRVGETDNYDSVTKISHCLGIAAKPSDTDLAYARQAMGTFAKQTDAAQTTMASLARDADVAQRAADAKKAAAKSATLVAAAMKDALAAYAKAHR